MHDLAHAPRCVRGAHHADDHLVERGAVLLHRLVEGPARLDAFDDEVQDHGLRLARRLAARGLQRVEERQARLDRRGQLAHHVGELDALERRAPFAAPRDPPQHRAEVHAFGACARDARRACTRRPRGRCARLGLGGLEHHRHHALGLEQAHRAAAVGGRDGARRDGAASIDGLVPVGGHGVRRQLSSMSCVARRTSSIVVIPAAAFAMPSSRIVAKSGSTSPRSSSVVRFLLMPSRRRALMRAIS